MGECMSGKRRLINSMYSAIHKTTPPEPMITNDFTRIELTPNIYIYDIFDLDFTQVSGRRQKLERHMGIGKVIYREVIFIISF